jgi:hypothetical protein
MSVVPPCPYLACAQSDTEVFFDLKKLLEDSKARAVLGL